MAVNKLLTSLFLEVGETISAGIELQARGGTAENLSIEVVFLDASDVVLVTDGVHTGNTVTELDSVDSSGPWYRSVISNLEIPTGAIKLNVGFSYDSLSVSTVTVASRRPVLNRGAKVAPYSRPSNDSTSGGGGLDTVSAGQGIITSVISLSETEVSVSNPIFIQGTAPSSPQDGWVWFDTATSPTLDASTLESNDSAYHLAWANFTGVPVTVGQTEAEAGTATTDRLWTSQRVAQAIAAQAGAAGPTHYIQSTTPASPVDGDVWFDTGASPTIPASSTSADTTNFGGALSASDDTVQKALDTLDDASGGGLSAPANESITGNWDFSQPITFGSSKLVYVNTTTSAIRSATTSDCIVEWQTSNNASHGAIGFNSSNIFEIYDQAGTAHIEKQPTSGVLKNYGTGVTSANIVEYRLVDSAGTSQGTLGYKSASDQHLELTNNVAGDLEIRTTNGTVRMFHNNNEKLASGDFGVTVTGVVTATGGDSDDWNDAFSWGDHALAGYGTGSGTVTSVSTGTGLDGSITTSGTISLDLNELAVGGTLLATDHLVAVNGTVSNKQLISSIPLSIFNNDSGFNNYTHPSYSGDDFSVDTGALSGATVVSDIDINVTTDSTGHVTDANGTVSTRTLTAANIGALATGGTAADSTLFAGVGAGSYMRSNLNEQFTVGTITWNDNVKIGFGTGNGEGTLYSNGTGTFWDFGADKDLTLRDVTTSRFLFDISTGDFHADGDGFFFSTSVGSDPKLKKNIKPITNSLQKVLNLNGVVFDWKKTGLSDAGLLSTDAKKVLPEIVKRKKRVSTDEYFDSVNYNGVVGLLVESIKELNAKVESLENDLAG